MDTTHLTPAPRCSAGTQPLRRLVVAQGLAALLILLASTALVKHVAASPHKATASHTCHATRVALHGTKSPTISCLDGRQRGAVRTWSTGSIGPLAHLSDDLYGCTSAVLILATGYHMRGNWLCINGSGLYNLPEASGWNDAALSYWAGCYDDTFAADSIIQGTWSNIVHGSYDGLHSQQGNFPNGGVGIYQLSSVQQWEPLLRRAGLNRIGPDHSSTERERRSASACHPRTLASPV